VAIFESWINTLEPQDAVDVMRWILKDRGRTVGQICIEIGRSIGREEGAKTFRDMVGLQADGSFAPAGRGWTGG